MISVKSGKRETQQHAKPDKTHLSNATEVLYADCVRPVPLTFLLAAQVGEIGIWLAAPFAEFLLLILTVGVLKRLAKARSLRWGVFQPGKQGLA